MVIRQTGENLKMKSLKEPYPKNLILSIQVTAVHEIQLPMYLVYVSSNSGSYRYAIDNVVSDGEDFCIYVKQVNNPEDVDDAMAGWFVLFAQPKSNVKDYATYDAQIA